MDENLGSIKQAYQVLRIGLGATAFAFPNATAKAMGIDGGDGTAVLLRLVGSRDAVLGIGQVLGERHDSARGWYEAAATVDLLDGIAMIMAAATGSVPKFRAGATAVFAFAGAGVGTYLARSGTEDTVEAESV